MTTMKNVMRVCKRWQRIAKNDEVWRVMCERMPPHQRLQKEASEAWYSLCKRQAMVRVSEPLTTRNNTYNSKHIAKQTQHNAHNIPQHAHFDRPLQVVQQSGLEEVQAVVIDAGSGTTKVLIRPPLAATTSG